MKTKIIVNGAGGKMGSMTATTLKQHPSFEVVAELDHQDNLATAISELQPDIVVDFTTATVAYDNARIIIDAKVHPVIGTTGLLESQIAQLQQVCEAQSLGGVIAPNFSMGAVLMMKYAADAAKYFNAVEIIETHHQHKIDSPSGTALHTSELIAKNLQACAQQTPQREIIPGARGAIHHKIPIHSIRLPGTVAHQQVIFGSNGETLSFKHDSINRECFMPGVVMACQKVLTLTTLVYGLECLL